MSDTLVHRGPDADGLYLSPDRRAGLGFRRLRVIDLSADADQPMANEDGSLRLVFNGEIYNFRDLRKELETKGHRFRSNADTETVLHLYEEEGSRAVERLDGMFALALWDERARRLLLARDRTGKKPLFYVHTDRFIAFASEIKAFFRLDDVPVEIDAEMVPQYMLHGYVPGPRTFYRGIRQLEPATLLTVEADGRAHRRRYWELNFRQAADQRRSRGTDADAAARTRDLVTKAVERRLISDVPIGAFLSGGIDSTIVVGVMSRLMGTPVRTFSIGFEGDNAYDETAYARVVSTAFRTDHTEFRVKPSAVDLLDTLLWHHDGPFGDSSAIPTYIVSRLTRQHVTVVLTGDGGDEVFAGYLRFAAAVAADRIPSSIARPLSAMFHRFQGSSERHWSARGRRFVEGIRLPPESRLTYWNSLFFEDLERLLQPDLMSTIPPVDRLAYLDGRRDAMRGLSTLGASLYENFSSYLVDDLLVKADRCTMANGLEARSPFLDTALIEYAGTLADRMKLRGLTTKFILRCAFADMLPASIARRGKMGFGVPLGTWFRADLRDYIQDTLCAHSARYRAFLSPAYVRQLVTSHQAGTADFGHHLWRILCFEVWLQNLPRWLHRPSAEPLALSGAVRQHFTSHSSFEE